MRNKHFLNFSLIALLMLGNFLVLKKLFRYIELIAQKSYRLEVHFGILNKWLSNRENKKSIGKYLAENGIHTVAVYGLGLFGTHLLSDLQEDNCVNVAYGIDRSVKKTDKDLKIYKPEDCLPQVDMIIVSVVFSFDEIKEVLEKKVDCTVISLQELIEDM